MATWIFQTNPKEFDIDSQLMEENRILWSIHQPQYEGKVKPQDIVFLWRSVGGRPARVFLDFCSVIASFNFRALWL